MALLVTLLSLHSFHEDFLNTSHVPGTVLGAGAATEEDRQGPYSWSSLLVEGTAVRKQIP